MAVRFITILALVVGVIENVYSQTQPQSTPRPNNGAGVTVSETTDPNAISGVLGSLANPPGGSTTIVGTDPTMGQWPAGFPGGFGNAGFGMGGCGGFYGNPWGMPWPMFPRPRPHHRPGPPMMRPVYIPVPVPVGTGSSRANGQNDDTDDSERNAVVAESHNEDQHKSVSTTEAPGSKDPKRNEIKKGVENGKQLPIKNCDNKTTTAKPIK